MGDYGASPLFSCDECARYRPETVLGCYRYTDCGHAIGAIDLLTGKTPAPKKKPKERTRWSHPSDGLYVSFWCNGGWWCKRHPCPGQLWVLREGWQLHGCRVA